MMKIKIVVLLVALIALVGNSSCNIDPYKWMYYRPYGSTVHLEPLFSDTQCVSQSQCYWLLPNKQQRLSYPLTSTSNSKYLIASDGTLTIIDIQPSDNGIYHFFRMNNSRWIVSKSLLNLRGAPYDSLWLEYWPNVVGGLVAMAVVLITFLLIMLADKYRYRAPSTYSTDDVRRYPVTIQPLRGPTSLAQTNPVFANDDDDLRIRNSRSDSSRCSSRSSDGTYLRVERF